jgi:crotonobetainyl-CoA:carnitine CoA-transferase CaiB-like acyl-CoA transferase
MDATTLMLDAWKELVAGSAVDAPPVELTATGDRLPSRLRVDDVAGACVGLALSAAVGLQRQRTGRVLHATLDRAHVAAAVCSERHFRRDGTTRGGGFAPFSRFWATSDGWVRTHANYPWHKAALLSALATQPAVDDMEAAMAEQRAEEIEAAVFAAGGVAGAVRTIDAWTTHAQGRAVASEPLIGHRLAGDARPRVLRARHVGDLPLEGVRVLDLTRVIAGPVCTRYLAALGAEVLRIDPPRRADMARGRPGDTLLGKRSAVLDFATPDGTGTLHDLVDLADVVVCGYRPGSLDRFGLGQIQLAERHPGLVVLYLSAWGFTGPWSERRGFDSIVQAPSGIAMSESSTGAEPGALPCQLLDHGTGYLAAAAVIDGLRRQATSGGTHVRWVSLARTAWWLTSLPRTVPSGEPGGADVSDWLVDLVSSSGPIRAVAPPGRFGGQALEWPTHATGYGDDRPAWR